MSQEIIEGIRTIEKEKGIEAGTLVAALEDALLAAYKKTPGAARHATVELDDDGEFRVFALDIPADLEERLFVIGVHVRHPSSCGGDGHGGRHPAGSRPPPSARSPDRAG